MLDPTRDVTDRLRSAGCVFAEDEAALLVAQAETPGRLEAMVAARITGTPLEYVLGWVEFCGARISVQPGVFVPRRRTQFLATQATAIARRLEHRPVVVDLCCGSGAIGAAIARALPGLELHAADLDPIAVRCARGNLGSFAVHEGDLFAALPARLAGRIDVLAVNAPYVPTESIELMPPEARDHERRTALDGGSDGLDVARRVVAGAPDWLAVGGSLLIETSDRQAPLLLDVMTRRGLTARVADSDDLGATVAIGTVGEPKVIL